MWPLSDQTSVSTGFSYLRPNNTMPIAFGVLQEGGVFVTQALLILILSVYHGYLEDERGTFGGVSLCHERATERVLGSVVKLERSLLSVKNDREHDHATFPPSPPATPEHHDQTNILRSSDLVHKFSARLLTWANQKLTNHYYGAAGLVLPRSIHDVIVAREHPSYRTSNHFSNKCWCAKLAYPRM